MKIVKPSVFEFKQEQGLNGIFKAIEYAGRTCYDSLDKITEDSAEKIVSNFKARKHGSPMEFGTVYLTAKLTKEDKEVKQLFDFYSKNAFSRVNVDKLETGEKILYITTNYRVLFENSRELDIKYLTSPTDRHEKRRFFVLTEDRGIMAEFTRHRSLSHCIQSTRYCNYSKDKYNKEITFIEPCFWEKDSECYKLWYTACQQNEFFYLGLLEKGATPEKARAVLNNSLKTIHCICGFESDWNHFFDLRLSERAHPQAIELARLIKEIF